MGVVWHKAPVFGCLPLAAPIGLPPLLILTLCGPERVLVVSTEPPDDLSCLTTAGVGRPGDGLLPVPLTRCIQMHTRGPCGGGGGVRVPQVCVPKKGPIRFSLLQLSCFPAMVTLVLREGGVEGGGGVTPPSPF